MKKLLILIAILACMGCSDCVIDTAYGYSGCPNPRGKPVAFCRNGTIVSVIGYFN